jgi:uncharacterized protein (DUF2235 family)
MSTLPKLVLALAVGIFLAPAAQAGRWLTQDPLHEGAGFVQREPNPYALVLNDPVNGIDLFGLAGYFFDGTSNNMYSDPANMTYVAALYTMYAEARFYVSGVGSPFSSSTGDRGASTDYPIIGSTAGAGMDARLTYMMCQLAVQFSNGDRIVDVFGFSRGAAAAREFANRVTAKYPGAQIRFLGLFDTVSQVGAPGHSIGVNLSIPQAVQFTSHAVAAGETRDLFPLTSVTTAYNGGKTNNPRHLRGDRFEEKPFNGAHSDIGGGYADGGNVLALKWMMRQAIAKGVPLNWDLLNREQKAYFSQMPSQWHSEQRSLSGFMDYSSLGGVLDIYQGKRTVYGGNLTPGR